jgi:hypothetical protein
MRNICGYVACLVENVNTCSNFFGQGLRIWGLFWQRIGTPSWRLDYISSFAIYFILENLLWKWWFKYLELPKKDLVSKLFLPHSCFQYNQLNFMFRLMKKFQLWLEISKCEIFGLTWIWSILKRSGDSY